MAKKTYTTKTIDDSGHLQSVRTNTVISNSEMEPNYIKMYIDDVSKLYGLSSGENNVLRELLRYLNYNNEIIITAYIKNTIKEDLNLSIKLIEKTISRCIKSNIMIRKQRGVYIVNPNLFGKGSWKNILRLRLELTYDVHGKTSNLHKEFDNNNNEFL